MMYARSRGGTPSRYRLDGNDLLEIPFPQINKDVQDMIATEVQRRKQEAQRLRGEAEKELEQYKTMV